MPRNQIDERTRSIVIVLDKAYRPDFAFLQEKDPRIVFADPGK